MVNYHHEDCYLGKEKPGFPTKDCRQCELLDQKDSCQETISNLEVAQKRLKTTIHELEKECDRLERLYSNGVQS
jgi:Zn-finger protein